VVDSRREAGQAPSDSSAIDAQSASLAPRSFDVRSAEGRALVSWGTKARLWPHTGGAEVRAMGLGVVALDRHADGMRLSREACALCPVDVRTSLFLLRFGQVTIRSKARLQTTRGVSSRALSVRQIKTGKTTHQAAIILDGTLSERTGGGAIFLPRTDVTGAAVPLKKEDPPRRALSLHHVT